MSTHNIELPQGYTERPSDYSGDLYIEGQVREIIEANVAPLQAEIEALRADAKKLRELLRTVSAVSIVQLFYTARDDVLAEFSLEELEEVCRVSEHLRPVYVERIYRAAWDAAMQEADQ